MIRWTALIGRTSQVNGSCMAADGLAMDMATMRLYMSLAPEAFDDQQDGEKKEDEKKKEEAAKPEGEKKEEPKKDEEKKEEPKKEEPQKGRA